MLDADEIEQICQESVLYFAVHGGAGAQGGADVDLHEPGLEVAVDQDVEAVEFEAAGPLFLCLGVDVKHGWLGTDAGLDDDLLDLVEELSGGGGTLSELMPTAS